MILLSYSVTVPLEKELLGNPHLGVAFSLIDLQQTPNRPPAASQTGFSLSRSCVQTEVHTLHLRLEFRPLGLTGHSSRRVRHSLGAASRVRVPWPQVALNLPTLPGPHKPYKRHSGRKTADRHPGFRRSEGCSDRPEPATRGQCRSVGYGSERYRFAERGLAGS